MEIEVEAMEMIASDENLSRNTRKVSRSHEIKGGTKSSDFGNCGASRG
jgi:hypothetical protein